MRFLFFLVYPEGDGVFLEQMGQTTKQIQSALEKGNLETFARLGQRLKTDPQ